MHTTLWYTAVDTITVGKFHSMQTQVSLSALTLFRKALQPLKYLCLLSHKVLSNNVWRDKIESKLGKLGSLK